MRYRRLIGRLIVGVLVLLATACSSADAVKPTPATAPTAAPAAPKPGVLFQYSTINALMGGRYEGDLTLAELAEHGNFGLGTVNGLDGEMIALGDKFYQITGDGHLNELGRDIKTPFAVITNFQPQDSFTLGPIDTFEGLGQRVADTFKHRNNFYAIKLTGEFQYIKARSVPRQTRPYRTLPEVTATQPTFEFSDISGTLLGFWSPDYVEGINVPGFHLHFVTADQTGGGHVLDVKVKSATVEVAALTDFWVSMPQGSEFSAADLTTFSGSDIQQVEGEGR